MKDYIINLIVFCALIFSAPSIADGEADTTLIKTIFPFHLCVRETTDYFLKDKQVNKFENNNGVELEGQIWIKVIDECSIHFGDEVKGLILLYYNGDTAKALGYWEGVVHSARTYVISKSITHMEQNH